MRLQYKILIGYLLVLLAPLATWFGVSSPDRSGWVQLAALAGAGVAVFAVAVWWALSVGRRLRKLTQAAEGVGAGDLSQQIQSRGRGARLPSPPRSRGEQFLRRGSRQFPAERAGQPALRVFDSQTSPR